MAYTMARVILCASVYVLPVGILSKH